MTPLYHHPEPDDRPTTAETVFAAVLFVVLILSIWLLDIIATVTP